MAKNRKAGFAALVSLLLAAAFFLAPLSAPVSAETGEAHKDKSPGTLLRLAGEAKGQVGTGMHSDPATFEKNFSLTANQKEAAITEIEKTVSQILDPQMSDLEKYYLLALWENRHVTYDWNFWGGSYNLDYYSHQWDAYGVLIEQNAVCVGIAITYANLCHAADLPCRFARCEPSYLDHTISYIPDINGNAYYADVTENSFLMSKYADCSFEPIDRKFAGIKKECTDGTFEYIDENDYRIPAAIQDFYNTDADRFIPVPFEKWFNEFALHKNTKKKFCSTYAEKGSGKRGTHYADYHDYPSQYSQKPDIWFLEDFYKEPAKIKRKILNKEFDEQLLMISGVEKNYDCENVEDAANAVINSISVKYFPSAENGEVVAKAAGLTKGTDYEVTYRGYDDTTHEAEFAITGKGDYSGEHLIRVKINSALVDKAPIRIMHLKYNGSPQKLVEPGKGINGTMVYAIRKAGDPEPDDESYSTDIPSATDAGRYDIWYKIIGDEKHFDSEAQRVRQPAEIGQLPSSIVAENMTVKVGETVRLKHLLSSGLDATFIYEVFDPSIATVSADGYVTGVSEGETLVDVSCELKNPSANYEEPTGDMATITVVPQGKPKPETISYRNVSGDGNVWHKGSNDTCDFTYKRSKDDASTFSHFKGISVDGKAVGETDYTKESGSVIIRLRPEYLETLAIGKHTLSAMFDDGDPSPAGFQVAAADEKSDQDESSEGSGGNGSEPGTGDDTNMKILAAALLLMLASGGTITALARRRRN